MSRLKVVRILVAFAVLVAPETGVVRAASSSATAVPMKDVNAGARTDPATVAMDPLVVTAVGDTMNRVGQPMFVTINIKNNAGDKLLMKNIVIKIDGASSARFAAPLTCELQQTGEITIARGLSFEQSCRFEMKEPELSWTLKSWQEALLAAEVRIAVTADINNLGIYHYYPSVSMKAPEGSIFLGGVLGALLLAVFVWIERILMNPEVRQAWLMSLWFTLLMGIRGGIMAIIALLLSKTTQGAGSPISLTVIDFTGGIMIGLFSYPLASWISSALKLDGVVAPAIEGKEPVTKIDESHESSPQK